MNRVENLRKTLNHDEAVYISGYANIFYYSGFTSSDARLIITPKESILLTDSRYTVQAQEQAPDFTLKDINDLDIIKKLEIKKLGFEEDHLTVKEFAKINKYSLELFPSQQKISSQREIKDSEEIKRISEAERLGDEAFSYILDCIKPGMSEKEVAFLIENFLRKNGAQKLSFETIAASGVRSSMPHGVVSDKIIEKGDFLTLDFGCVLDGYCSDMTRTVAIGEVNQKQKEIYDIVLAAQIAACEFIAEGKTCAEVDYVARKIIEDSGYGECFGHSLGHGVGIEVHEEPRLSPKSTQILKKGHAVTIEPGIYIDGFGGVRIEDLVIIGEKNTVNLTKSPKELIIL